MAAIPSLDQEHERSWTCWFGRKEPRVRSGRGGRGWLGNLWTRLTNRKWRGDSRRWISLIPSILEVQTVHCFNLRSPVNLYIRFLSLYTRKSLKPYESEQKSWNSSRKILKTFHLLSIRKFWYSIQSTLTTARLIKDFVINVCCS